MDNGIFRLELDLSQLAKKMIGQVMTHNEQLAECVRDEVENMVESGLLEALIRRHTQNAVDTAVKDCLHAWEVQEWMRKRFTKAIIGEENAGTT
jgi:hypothetical protein